ncbi:MAG TPA: response regulator [Gemmataceae bacterium]|nr:response regulator [Gemmataceae bacterium]
MTTPLRILFIEDSEDDVLLLARQLRRGGYSPTYERVETADGLRSALHRGGWDVIISDYSTPRFSGLEALAITLQLAPEVPFLLISGTVGEEVAVESIKAGAADYLMKQNLIRFVPAVARALRDAAERKAMRRAEAVLREQRALLSMIYDNTSDALILFTWDPAEVAWKLTSVNRATLLMGKVAGAALNEGDLVGRRFEDVARALTAFWGGNADDLLDDFYRVAESGRTRTREARLAEGTAGVHVEITLIPFFGPDGRSRHVLAAARDITARKRAEAARREFEARLAHSRKMEALGQLAGGVAHDFNNILTGILGFADLIRTSATDPATAGFSSEIVQAAARARDLVRQILMFSRRQPAERKPLRLSGIVREALRLIRGSAPAAVRVVALGVDDEPYILGDPTQLHQVVMNLCTNSIQAMGEEGGRLEVTVEPVNVGPDFAHRHPPLREGTCIRLEVADTGPGIPQAILDRLFEPFFTTKAPGVGTGLGLSVVHGVVQNHEGAIVVRSRTGEGTGFEVYLPAVGSPSWSGEVIVTEKANAGGGRRILFVDDEASIARLAQVMLKSLGHTAITYAKPADGLAALQATPDDFDLVITDLTMPGMTGVDLARGIRQVRADIPIILSSGYADEVPDETLKVLGIVEVLPKPFQMQALGAAVARATGRK